jgi:hypothetical protein
MLTYSTYVSSLANLMPVDASDPGFVAVLGNIIDDAELRLYRALDLVDSSQRDSSSTFTTLTRNFNLPTSLGTFIVCDEINVITPVGTTDPELGTRNQLIPTSDEMLNALWPSVNGSTIPQYFAMINQDLIIVGPWPDAAYTVEVVGTQRPTPLSVSNTTTPLTTYFPDLFLAASMVFAAGYMKNFGAMSDDPKMAQSWQAHYDSLLADAKTEEARKQFTSQGWSDKSPTPPTTAPRT